MDEFYRAVCALPEWLARPLNELPEQTAEQIHEVRLRAGCAVWLTMQGTAVPVGELPTCPQTLKNMRLSKVQLEEAFYTLCKGTVHTYQAELAQGYITIQGGHRVGVGGKYIVHPEQGVLLETVQALNLRIARAREIFLPAQLKEILQGHFTGLLVAGEPGSGKTTLLRSMACFLAEQRRMVTVIDERGELWPEKLPESGTPPLDILAGLPKQQAIQMALRTMAPQVIVLDEMGGMDQVRALEQGFFGGVDCIASIHASSLEQALSRPQLQYMKAHGMARVLVLLDGRQKPGQIREVCFL